MEFVLVTFPTQRRVRMDGAQQGDTGQIIGVQRGTHIFDLGKPPNYAPPSVQTVVANTSQMQPLVIPFEPAMLPVTVGGPSSRGPVTAARPPARRATRAKKVAHRKSAAARKKAAPAKTKSTRKRASGKTGTATRRSGGNQSTKQRGRKKKGR